METKRTRDEARAAWERAGLTNATVTRDTLKRLRELINNQMKASGCMRGTFRCRQRGTIEQTPRGPYAALLCKSDYFDGREAVSFNTDGFVGFAGWADSTNVQPILAGFEAWVAEMQPMSRENYATAQ